MCRPHYANDVLMAIIMWLNVGILLKFPSTDPVPQDPVVSCSYLKSLLVIDELKSRKLTGVGRSGWWRRETKSRKLSICCKPFLFVD